MRGMFTREFLQAVNDWQRGGDANMKARRGLRLKDIAPTLDERFRRTDSRCYRRISLDKVSVFDLGENLKLAETISAWTFDLEFAKQFKEGVPEAGWLGVIFGIMPEPGQVVLNLSSLYGDESFNEACDSLRGEIKGFEMGIGRYSGTQKEVVLQIEHVPIHSIVALGGYSSDLRTIAAKYFGRPATDGELAAVEEALRLVGRSTGAWWLTGAGKDRAVKFWIDSARALKPFRK